MPDISETLAPKSDQLDNIDLRGGPPRIFTVTRVDVRSANTDQPVSVHLAEFPRPWKPGVNMRRVLAHCWGRKSEGWIGNRVELFCDERIKYGNETPGGTRISRISGISKTENAPVLLSQGRPGFYKVEPLPDTAPASAPVEEAAPSPVAALLAEVKQAAERAGVTLDAVAAEWAESHAGQPIREATDVGGLELLRDELQGRAS